MADTDLAQALRRIRAYINTLEHRPPALRKVQLPLTAFEIALLCLVSQSATIGLIILIWLITN